MSLRFSEGESAARDEPKEDAAQVTPTTEVLARAFARRTIAPWNERKKEGDIKARV